MLFIILPPLFSPSPLVYAYTIFYLFIITFARMQILALTCRTRV